MFIFKSKDGRMVHITNSGIYDPIKDLRIGIVFLLEKLGDKSNQGYPYVNSCMHNTPEQFVTFFNNTFNWDVFAVKLCEIEWE